jgi:hypothetical protein
VDRLVYQRSVTAPARRPADTRSHDLFRLGAGCGELGA